MAGPPAIRIPRLPPAGHGRLAPASPLALTVKLDPTASPLDPALLTTPCVAVTLAPHPSLTAAMAAIGATADRGVFTLPSSSTPSQVAAAVASVAPRYWRVAKKATLAGVLGQKLTAELAQTSPGWETARRGKAAATLTVSRSAGHITVTPAATGLTLAGVTARTWPVHRLLLSATAAFRAIDDARRAGIPVFDSGRLGSLAALHSLFTSRAVALPVDGAPGWASFDVGSTIRSGLPVAVPVADVPALLARLPEAATAIHHQVQVAHSLTSACPAGRPGLYRWQDAFVSAYLASPVGVVNALPPGLGKTVCAAAAFSARAEGRVGYRAVAVVPPSVRSQWLVELREFFPAATTFMLTAPSQAVAVARDLAATSAPAVVVCSQQASAHLAGALEERQLRLDDVAVDEATFLRSGTSERTAGAWRLRDLSARAMPMTGTPNVTGECDTGNLVEFVFGRRGMFDRMPLNGPHPFVPAGADRLGPWVYRGTGRELDELPPVVVEVASLQPSIAEEQIITAAAKRTQELAAAPAKSTLESLAARRAAQLGLASPDALARSKFALATDLRVAGWIPGPGSKVAYTAIQAARTAADGGRVLVFCDFPAVFTELGAALASAGVAFAAVTSATPPAGRAALAEKFIAGGIPVMLVSQVAHLGVNLTGANLAIHLDVPESAAFRQRNARTARLGTKGQVRVLVPVLAGSSEVGLAGQLTASGA